MYSQIIRYVEKQPGVDKTKLLLDAAEGLAHLHQERIVHGNVRCANILITSQGEACIAEFGMSKVIGDITETPATTTLTETGSTRWLAPELIFDLSMVSPTLACDTWSFAMSMLECFTMRPPWADVKREAHVVSRMNEPSSHPTRPLDTSAPTDLVWQLMLDCWYREPEKRPSMVEVADRLHSSFNLR